MIFATSWPRKRAAGDVRTTREQEKQRKHGLEVLRGILEIPREEDFVRTIRELGYADDPEKLEEILKAWRDLSSSRKR
jgi:hypothetical protein